MRLTFLGTGTSQGQPMIGCQCEVCRSTDPHDKRLRMSALVETDTTRLLIDCGPDFRQQILPYPFRKIDGLLITHAHFDHIGGIDDLRPFCILGNIDIYANSQAIEGIRSIFPYCFAEHLYPGVPKLHLHQIEAGFEMTIGDINFQAINIMHGNLPILGYRFGDLTYITDMKSISPASLNSIMGTHYLIINALRFEREHHSHQLVADAIDVARRIGAERTWIIHTCHHIGKHEDVNAKLPQDIQLAYDGEVIDF